MNSNDDDVYLYDGAIAVEEQGRPTLLISHHQLRADRPGVWSGVAPKRAGESHRRCDCSILIKIVGSAYLGRSLRYLKVGQVCGSMQGIPYRASPV